MHKSIGMIGAGLLLLAGLVAPATGSDKKVLMFTKSQGFQHPVVARGKNGELGLAERTVIDLGKKNGFEVTVTKDGGQITPENLRQYKALFFYTQGDIDKEGLDKQPPVSKEHRAAILDFVHNGGGFVGTHCGGADTFHNWVEGAHKPFLDMVGGEFKGHGAQQVSRVEVVDPSFPAVAHLPKQFSLNDEWYTYNGFHKNMHVLIMLETEGMKGGLYQRPPYPITWCSTYGKGKVFYTGMGHREDVWENPAYQEMVGKAVQWVLGDVAGDASPNLGSLFGNVDQALQRINQLGTGK